MVPVLCAFLAAAMSLTGGALAEPAAPSYPRNPALADLPQGRWVKIHQQQPGDAVTFRRQRHGGSAFDTRRGQLVLFGSDTHDHPDIDWLNSPLIFDMNRLTWDQPYPADPVSSYRVNADGLPVAGPNGDRPWAMHTFGAVAYDPVADAVVVASYPAHLVPGRFTSVLESAWPQVERHPTWLWHPESQRWEALAGKAPHFFTRAIVYDDRRKAVLGYRGDGVYTLDTASGRWQRIAKGSLLGWGSNAAFDSDNGVLLAFGSHRKGNDIVAYNPAAGLHRTMPAAGPRPAGNNYVPMAFHRGIGRTIALVDSASGDAAETWQYDYASDAWTHLELAGLPFEIRMNYNLEFDPVHELLLLVATAPGETLPAVWALNFGEAG